MSGPFDSDSDSMASQALLAAALGGLLCLASACGGGTFDGSENQGVDLNAYTGGGEPGAYIECKEGQVANPTVTETKEVVDMTEEAFTAECDARNGVVEVEPHCGGSNGCRGFSYDSTIDARTEHTCKGANTCSGWSCVICD